MNPGPPRTQAQVMGGEAEGDAARFLERQGVRLLARNYRTRFGEIDLIAMDGEVLAFVEVRMRSSGRFGGALESITTAKQRRIASAAAHFLQRFPGEPRCRFDVVILQEGPPQWHKAAFEAG
jgi:putative endonuclease